MPWNHSVSNVLRVRKNDRNHLYPSYSRVLKLLWIHLTPGSWNYSVVCIHLTPGSWNYSVFILLQGPETTLYSSYSMVMELLRIHLTPGSWNYSVFILLQGHGTTPYPSYSRVLKLLCIQLTPRFWNYSLSILLQDSETTLCPYFDLTPGPWNYSVFILLQGPKNYPVFIWLQGFETTLYQTYSELRGSCIFYVSSICIPGIICIHHTLGFLTLLYIQHLIRGPKKISLTYSSFLELLKSQNLLRTPRTTLFNLLRGWELELFFIKNLGTKNYSPYLILKLSLLWSSGTSLSYNKERIEKHSLIIKWEQICVKFVI